MNNEFFYTVYETTNTKNGYTYIGVHKTKNPNDSYLGSGTLICEAIKNHGRQSFSKKVLAVFDNPYDMLDLEAKLVDESFLLRNDTYNLKLGGHYDPFSSWIQFASPECLSEHGRKRGERGRMKVKELKRTDPEFREKLRKAQSEGMKRAIAEGRKVYPQGRKKSEITRSKIRESVCKSVAPAKTKSEPLSAKIYNPITGEKKTVRCDEVETWLHQKWIRGTSPETKKKMRETWAKKRKATKIPGDQIIWIKHKEKRENKKIRMKYLDEYQQGGWERGRKLN